MSRASAKETTTDLLFALIGVFFDCEYCLMEAMLFCFCEQFGEHCCFHAPHPTTLLARRKADSSAKRGQPNSYLEILITTDELAEDSSIILIPKSRMEDRRMTWLPLRACPLHGWSLSALVVLEKCRTFPSLLPRGAILRNIIRFQPF